MKIFNRIERIVQYGDEFYIPKFLSEFPELRAIPREKLCERFKNLGVIFYTKIEKKVNPWIRLTLPFGLLFMVLAFLSLPFVFMVTGSWFIDISKNQRLYNWLKQLKLI